MTDVIVFQMGKVASTAICNALNNAGIQAEQSHFLTENSIIEMAKRLTNPAINDFFAKHTEGQLIANSTLLRKINRFKQNQSPTEKIKIITLCRDPLNWYQSEFIQNFQGYFQEINTWLNDNSLCSDTQNESERLRFFFTIAFEIADSITIPMTEAEYKIELYKRIGKKGLTQAGCLAKHIVKFLHPIKWFPDQFEPVFGIDLLEYTLSSSNPTRRISNSFADILLLRYENISTQSSEFAKFCDLPSIDIPIKNSSKNKDCVALVKKAFEQPIPNSIIQQLYSSKYCLQFGYTYPQQIENPALISTQELPSKSNIEENTAAFINPQKNQKIAISETGKFHLHEFSSLRPLNTPLIQELPQKSTTVTNCFASKAVLNENKTIVGGLYEKCQLIENATFRGTTANRPVDPKEIPIDRFDNAKIIKGKCIYMGWLLSHFGHILLEAPARFWILKNLDIKNCTFVFHPLGGNPTLKNILNIEFAKILFDTFEIKKEQILLVEEDMVFEDLIIPNSLFYLSLTLDKEQLFVYDKIKDYLSSSFASSISNFFISSKNQPQKLYLSRKKLSDAKRKALNEDLIEDLFIEHGFQVVYLEQLNIKQQIQLISGADIIAGCDGSALHLGLFAKPTAKMIVLSARDIGVNQLLVNALKDIETHFVCARSDNKPLNWMDSWDADIPRIKAFLEKNEF